MSCMKQYMNIYSDINYYTPLKMACCLCYNITIIDEEISPSYNIIHSFISNRHKTLLAILILMHNKRS
jgi:hypothetical protein